MASIISGPDVLSLWSCATDAPFRVLVAIDLYSDWTSLFIFCSKKYDSLACNGWSARDLELPAVATKRHFARKVRSPWTYPSQAVLGQERLHTVAKDLRFIVVN